MVSIYKIQVMKSNSLLSLTLIFPHKKILSLNAEHSAVHVARCACAAQAAARCYLDSEVTESKYSAH